MSGVAWGSISVSGPSESEKDHGVNLPPSLYFAGKGARPCFLQPALDKEMPLPPNFRQFYGPECGLV